MTTNRAFWNRDFVLLYQGGIVSALGDQAYLVALMLWIKQNTDSATINGIVLFASGITGLLMPLGGTLADRYSRVRILVLLDFLSALSVLGLAALLWFPPPGSSLVIPAVLGLAVLRGVCMALFYPVEAALMPELIPAESLTSANSLLESTMRLTGLIGQGLGGVLFRLLGAPLLLLWDGISFLLSALSEMFIREPPRTHTEPEKRPTLLESLRDGFRYTGQVRGFRIYLVEASLANFFLAALTVGLPYYVEDVLTASPDWYGYLLAGMSLGAITGNVVAGRCRLPGIMRGTVQIIGLAFFSGCLIPLAFVNNPWVALIILTFAWGCVGFHQVLLMTLVQKRTPRALRGRVFGLQATIRQCMTPLGAATFGLLIDRVESGVSQVLIGCGIAGLVTVAIAASLADYRWFFTGSDEEIPA